MSKLLHELLVVGLVGVVSANSRVDNIVFLKV